jgi:predicted ATPase/class 3 adenylate cyclase
VGAPSGTVTFLFTDIEGSTRLWEERPEAMRASLARHDELLRSAIEGHRGYVFSVAGDGVAAAFQRSGDAVAAAVDAQRALSTEPWPDGAGLQVRMGLHTGEAEERDGNYFGSPLNRAARLMAAAHGGQVVVSDITAHLLGDSAAIGLVDLGSHRLRGMVEAIRVFGVKADGLDWVEEPLVTAEPARGNLPRLATQWFGSVAELNLRAEELQERRCMTLTGPGGVGKTRLAIEAGELVAGSFPDGVWLVDLAPVVDRDSVYAAMAATLGIAPQDGSPVERAVLDWLERRRLLLIVDNCEHVLEPVAELVGAVVRSIDTVTVLATSREPLGVPGERVVPVPSLNPADAVELFCDRARAADSSLTFDGADREVIGMICDRLDNIPLAVELAAARARSLGPADLLARLSDRFRLLRGGGRAGIERHQTLRATVAWSYQLLSETEQAVFDRLSVFAADFDLAAATAVAPDAGDDSDTLDVLAALVDKSMLTVTRSGSTARYRVLETLRQYGEEGLGERGETEDAQTRHLAYFVRLARETGERWNSPRGIEATETLRREWNNLRAAITTAVARGDAHAAEVILDATFGYALVELRFEHGEWAEAVVALATSGIPVSPTSYGYAASFAWRAGSYDAAMELASRGVLQAPNPEHPSTLVSWAYYVIAALTNGKLREGAEAAAHLRAVAAGGDAAPIHELAASSAFLMLAAGEDRASIEPHVVRMTTIATATGSPPLIALASMAEGIGRSFLDDPVRTAAAYQRSLALAEEIGATHMAVGDLGGIAASAVAQAAEAAPQLCYDALARSYDARFWTATWIPLMATAGYFDTVGDKEGARTVVGYLEANQPGVVRGFRVRGAAWVLALPDSGNREGKTMDRHAVVLYALRRLEERLPR